MPAAIRIKVVASGIGFYDSDGRGVAQRAKALFARAELLVCDCELVGAPGNFLLNLRVSFFQFSAMQGNPAHFAPALPDRHDEEDILKHHPGCVLHPTPIAGSEYPENRLWPVNAAQEMIDRMIEIVPADTGKFRNVVPQSVEEMLKKVQVSAWDKAI